MSHVPFVASRVRRCGALLLAIATASCSSNDEVGEGPPPIQAENHRPRFHFTPPSGWMNDPNGLVFADGTYHLFYQFDPDRRIPLRQHWGHARSPDLVHWEHRPIAIFPDRALGLAYSGSGVVDHLNTSGLCAGGRGCLVAIFTQSGGSDGGQKQSLAISNDGGDTWTPYSGNPVLSSRGSKAFRDPKVFWHERTSRWVMVVAAGDRVQLYGSKDLVDWAFLSEFGTDDSSGGVWECPDLFELPVDGGAAGNRWVLKVDFNPGPFIGFSRARCFVGDFDGERFVPDRAGDQALDWGADFYAAQSWSDVSDGRRLWIAWMSNWKYALSTPTDPWRGAMTLPREVGLATTPEGPRLTQRPVPEVAALHGRRLISAREVRLAEASRRLGRLSASAFDLQMRIRPGGTQRVQLDVRVGERQRTSVVYDTLAGELSVDRSEAGDSSFDRRFPSRHTAPLDLARSNGILEMRVLVDESSIEVFAAGGAVVISDLIFPDPASVGLALESDGGEPWVESLTIHEMSSIQSPGE